MHFNMKILEIDVLLGVRILLCIYIVLITTFALILTQWWKERGVYVFSANSTENILIRPWESKSCEEGVNGSCVVHDRRMY